MRTTVLILASALALCACDVVKNHLAKQDAKPAAPAATVRETVTAPVTAEGEAVPPANGLPAQPPAPPAPPMQVAAAPAAPTVVRWAAADWPRQEHRLAALIANAETRDTIGDTHRVVNDADARRRRCTTKACIERAYADEEAWLRQWEGSSAIR